MGVLVLHDGSMFSVAIDSMEERDKFSFDTVFSEVLVVDPVVMVSRWAKLESNRGHELDLKISEGSGFSPGTELKRAVNTRFFLIPLTNK